MKHHRIPDYGIDIMEGQIGSGKSWWLVRYMMHSLAKDRRPVLTNLPLRWKVVRAYLRHRHGAEVAALIKPLSESHFARFLERCHERSQFVEEARRLAAAERRQIFSDELDRMWYAKAGPDRYEDDGPLLANWIPPYSLVVIDELQLWYPMSSQKTEDPRLLAYLTMSRHLMHQIIVATQDKMQVSISFRRNCRHFWRAYNKLDDKIAWGIRFKHLFGWLPFLGMALGHACWRGSDINEGLDVRRAEPISQTVSLPLLPSNRWVFRLYESFSRLGSPYRMREVLGEVRRSAGLRGDGKSRQEVRWMVFKERSRAWKFLTFVGRWTRRLVVVGFCLGLGLILGHISKPHRSDPVPPSGPALASPGSDPQADFVWPFKRLQAFGPGYVRIDGERVDQGSELRGVQLRFVHAQSRSVVCVARDELWLWKQGAAPERIGPVDAVMAAAGSVVQGRSLDRPANGQSGGVGTSESDDVRRGGPVRPRGS